LTGLDSTTKSFDTAWELMKANTPCCPNKRMVERKDGTMRCRVCGSTDRVTKSDDKGDNTPTNPSLWAQAKSKARSKFKVYPSAYANGWASKWYKSKGGGWKKKGKKSKK
jgi:radical SAM superfamily enzyme